MPTLKVVVDTATAFRLHQLALSKGRSMSETMRLLIERSLMTEPGTPEPDAMLDKCERTKGNVQSAAYLSGPLAKAIKRLAVEQDRSQSWTLRDLLRCELRRRGLLPTPAGAPATVDAALESAH
jgi:hypothetical protein